MIGLQATLRQAAGDLAELGYGFAVVGGLAVSARTEPRFTRDVDFAVAVVNDRAAEGLIFALQQRGYAILASVEQDETERLATIRLSSPGDRSVVLDLLFASSGIEAEVVAEAESLVISPDLTLPVARTGHLIALKVLSRDDHRRPRDIADLRALIPAAEPGDRELVEVALRLIQSRGYDRGKDLLREWRELLAESQT